MISFSADATPLRIKKDVVEGMGHLVVRRRGGHPVELLVLRAFLLGSCTEAGPAIRQAYLRDPIVLSTGKSVEHHYSAMVSALPTLTEMGATAVRISHYAWDGAIFSAMRKLMHSRHELPHLHARGERNGDAWLPALCDWRVYTRCACHDASLSL